MRFSPHENTHTHAHTHACAHTRTHAHTHTHTHTHIHTHVYVAVEGHNISGTDTAFANDIRVTQLSVRGASRDVPQKLMAPVPSYY